MRVYANKIYDIRLFQATIAVDLDISLKSAELIIEMMLHREAIEYIVDAYGNKTEIRTTENILNYDWDRCAD